jgi:DNA-binding response OmpR family regulator
MKLLIAEDDAFFRNILAQVLAPEHELIFTHDGDQAWAALQNPTAPRLAILDWVMPGLSGPEICRRVRACEGLSSMHLILFTARNSGADITAGLRAGADDYITKPFDLDELRARVRIGQHKLDRDAIQTQSIVINHALHHAARAAENLIRSSFFLGQSAEGGLYGVSDCTVRPVAGGASCDSNSELIATYRMQHSPEKLHA